ncbi:MAG: molybdopterin molybdochelatase [Segetibacter sp.]|nr:molybdopterin molybdochelatase [Segetibacter sp.]
MYPSMISVSEAKEIVLNNATPLTPVIVAIKDAAGLVLSEDVYASTDIPAFNQSSMDGYAFCFNDYSANKQLQIIGEVAAGDNKSFDNFSQKTIRIFTGAPVPDGADTVVMQEKVVVEGDALLITDEQLCKGSNVRPRGSEIKAGSLALKAGTYLSAGAIGFLAGIGTAKVNVYPKPRVGIIITGNELQEAGQPLQPGQVYESNSLTLKAALKQLHIEDVKTAFASDELGVIKQSLEAALTGADLVILSGGVSVGDYDFVLKAAEACGVATLFHKVKQKPGKPVFCGKKDNKFVFGLPGNPSSVLTCFYQYVVPAIEQLINRKGLIEEKQLSLAKRYTKPVGLTLFLKGFYEGNKVTPLGSQESYKLSSFAIANCLICLDEDKSEFKEGDVVVVYKLPI